jgi:hypothetical protein
MTNAGTIWHNASNEALMRLTSLRGEAILVNSMKELLAKCFAKHVVLANPAAIPIRSQYGSIVRDADF